MKPIEARHARDTCPRRFSISTEVWDRKLKLLEQPAITFNRHIAQQQGQRA
jgi:hypothetical protein